jgi:hypothetical protein
MFARLRNQLPLPPFLPPFLVSFCPSLLLSFLPSVSSQKHHNLLDHKSNTPTGHQILTFFLYLNDVEGEGKLRFTELGIDLKPKKVVYHEAICMVSHPFLPFLQPCFVVFTSACNCLIRHYNNKTLFFSCNSSQPGPRAGVVVRIEQRSGSF